MKGSGFSVFLTRCSPLFAKQEALCGITWPVNPASLSAADDFSPAASAERRKPTSTYHYDGVRLHAKETSVPPRTSRSFTLQWASNLSLFARFVASRLIIYLGILHEVGPTSFHLPRRTDAGAESAPYSPWETGGSSQLLLKLPKLLVDQVLLTAYGTQAAYVRCSEHYSAAPCEHLLCNW